MTAASHEHVYVRTTHLRSSLTMCPLCACPLSVPFVCVRHPQSGEGITGRRDHARVTDRPGSRDRDRVIVDRGPGTAAARDRDRYDRVDPAATSSERDRGRDRTLDSRPGPAAFRDRNRYDIVDPMPGEAPIRDRERYDRDVRAVEPPGQGLLQPGTGKDTGTAMTGLSWTPGWALLLHATGTGRYSREPGQAMLQPWARTETGMMTVTGSWRTQGRSALQPIVQAGTGTEAGAWWGCGRAGVRLRLAWGATPLTYPLTYSTPRPRTGTRTMIGCTTTTTRPC